MKKLLTIFCTIILTITMVLIIISYSTESIVINTLSSELTTKKISGRIMDFVIDYDVNELDNINNIVKSSKQIHKITRKFLNSTIENVSYNKETSPDIHNEINTLVNVELSDNINEETRNKIISDFNNYGNELENEFKIYLSGFSYNYSALFKIYYILTGNTFRIPSFVVLCISLITLILIQKIKSINEIKNATIITFIIATLFLILLKLSQNYIDHNFAGGRLNNLNTTMLNIFVVILALLSAILVLLNIKLKDKYEV